MELATKIRQARTNLNLTAKQAAEQWGVNPLTLEDYEQGRRKPRGFALKALNDLLDTILADKLPVPASSAAMEASASTPPAKPKKLRRRSTHPAPLRQRPPKAR